jgi:hypothetical protein
MTTTWIVLVIVAVLLAFFLGWRWASRNWQLPCPSLFGWFLETPFYHESAERGRLSAG